LFYSQNGFEEAGEEMSQGNRFFKCRLTNKQIKEPDFFKEIKSKIG